MKITLFVIGKTDSSYLKDGILDYMGRIGHYLPFEMKVIPDLKKVKNLSEQEQKGKEGKLLLNQVRSDDYLILLDERGKEFSSKMFASFLEKKMVAGLRNVVFIIGGPYGFSSSIYDRADLRISLSKMTFSHQMVRLIFTEQLYRAMTIIKGEPYHHE